MKRRWLLGLVLVGLVAVGCGGSSSGDDDDTGDGGADGGGADAGARVSNIKHVVVVVQENHTFDNYFGRYCTAPAGSNPTCTAGPACCERAPDRDPSGALPIVLDDAANGGYDPNHDQDCELSEMNGGAMDRFVTGASCSNPKNWAISPDPLMATYHGYARAGALADRYFQSVVGASSSNDMFFAVAKFVFKDNSFKPDTVGQGCIAPLTPKARYTGQTTIADLLLQSGHSFAYYAMGFRAMHEALLCPSAPSDCTSIIGAVCNYDPSDVPFQYYAQFQDAGMYASSMRDTDDFFTDVSMGRLPDVSFLKAAAYKNEHPNFSTKISNGVAFVSSVVDAVAGSRYAADTLVLVTWDEGGGFFDHVRPPASPDANPLGTRVPLLALGRFAKANTVSHVELEHASVVRFLELNFLGATGQLGARDVTAANLGSLLDGSKTGIVIP